MARFSYTARTMTGGRITGQMEAADVEEIRSLLRHKELFLVRADEGAVRSRAWNNKRKPGPAEIALVSRQLALLLEAGVPIVTALRVLIEQTPNQVIARALRSVQKEIVDGGTLSEALGKQQDVFTEVQVTLARVGEAGGVLTVMLIRAADQLDYSAMMRRKMVTAFTYPTVVLAAAIAVVAGILTFVVPVFADVYSRFHAQLPLATQVLITTSSILLRFGWLVILAIIALFVLVRARLKKPSVRRRVDGWKLRWPIFGSIFKKLAIAQFAYSLASLLRSGVPLMSSMSVAGQVCGNARIADSIEQASKLISEGQRLTSAFEQSGIFPPLMISVVDAGEQSSKLSEMLDHLARHYEDEVNNSMDRIASLLEPLLTMGVGLIVAGVLLALYMPIFNLGKVMAR